MTWHVRYEITLLRIYGGHEKITFYRDGYIRFKPIENRKIQIDVCGHPWELSIENVQWVPEGLSKIHKAGHYRVSLRSRTCTIGKIEEFRKDKKWYEV